MRRYKRPQLILQGTITGRLPTALRAFGDAVSAKNVEFIPRTYDGTEIKRTKAVKLLMRLVHNLNGCRLNHITGTSNGDAFDLFWRGKIFVGRSAQEVFRRARREFPAQRKCVGEILAFRAWQLQGEFLQSLTRTHLWKGPIAHSNELPALENTHGLYAVKLDQAKMRNLVHDYMQAAAYGFVGLYGRVIEHEDGYRAEHLIIRKITLRIPASAAFRALLADRYQCEISVEKPSVL